MVQRWGQGSQSEPGLQKEATKACPPALDISREKGLLAGHAKTSFCVCPVVGASPQCPLVSEGTVGKLQLLVWATVLGAPGTVYAFSPVALVPRKENRI